MKIDQHNIFRKSILTFFFKQMRNDFPKFKAISLTVGPGIGNRSHAKIRKKLKLFVAVIDKRSTLR